METTTRGIRMLASILGLLVCSSLLLASRGALAYSMYQDRIPNGHNVKDPSEPHRSWPAVGHVTSVGGDLNPFGVDFVTQGKRWTVTLCRKDSDGDGASNGVELGDPDCEWRPGQEPKFTSPITHPGIPGDYPPSSSSASFAKIA